MPVILNDEESGRRWLDPDVVERLAIDDLIAALVCMLVTITGMLTSFDESQAVVASSANLAEGIETSLIPSTVGLPPFVGGVILFVGGVIRFVVGTAARQERSRFSKLLYDSAEPASIHGGCVELRNAASPIRTLRPPTSFACIKSNHVHQRVGKSTCFGRR